MGRIVFEMSGIPGAGKTTLTYMIIDSFSDYHFLTDVSFYRKKQRFISRIRTLWYWLIPRYREIKSLLKTMGRKCVVRENHMLFLKKKMSFIRCLGLYNRYISKNNIALSEGVIQGLFELMDYVEVSEREMAIQYCVDILRKVKQVFPNIKFCLLILDYDVAHDRIVGRKDTNNSVDRMESKKQLQFLRKRYENAILLYEKCEHSDLGVFVLNGEKSLNELLAEICIQLHGE